MTTDTPQPIALAQNLELLEQAEGMLRELPHGLYAEPNDEPGFRFSPGPHLRHSIDAYCCLLDGLDKGEVDYDARTRSREVETSRERALEALASVRARLQAIDKPPEHRLRVQVDVPAEAGDGATESTLGREYQFLVGHTVHHYALIAMILRQRGYETSPDFGVAPSTLRFWRENND